MSSKYGDAEDIDRNIRLFYETNQHSYLDRALKLSKERQKEKTRSKNEQGKVDKGTS